MEANETVSSNGLVANPTLGIEMQVLANIVSAIAYGAVIILFSCCFWQLQGTKQSHSRKMRPFLYLYITLMFAMGTMAFIQETIYTTKVLKGDIFPKSPDLLNYLTSLGEPVPLIFTIWGADGFMLWRCLILYQGILPARRLVLVIFLTLLCMTSLGSGIAFFVVAGIFQSESANFWLPYVPDSLALPFQNPKQSAVSSVIMFCTTFVNLTLTTLVFLRLLYYQKFISKTLGKAYSLPYTKVITMCVESCALIVVFSIVNIVMIITNNVGYLIPFLLLPQICTIAPLLIVYRVALGRSTNANTIVSSGANNRSHGADVHSEQQGTGRSVIRFHHVTSSLAVVEDFVNDPDPSPTTSDQPELIEMKDIFPV